jgi:two-component sensor histidine kinase
MVLTELVQNAVEHAEAGRIEVVVDRTADVLTVAVVDDGRGLPVGFQLDQSTRLGLRIVRTLVEGELRGTLSLEAAEAGGTTARLVLPLAGEDRDEGG